MPTWTQQQRDTLAAAVASGVRSVTYDNRSVTYGSLEEMRALLAEMDRQLAAVRTHRLAATSKGA